MSRHTLLPLIYPAFIAFRGEIYHGQKCLFTLGVLLLERFFHNIFGRQPSGLKILTTVRLKILLLPVRLFDGKVVQRRLGVVLVNGSRKCTVCAFDPALDQGQRAISQAV